MAELIEESSLEEIETTFERIHACRGRLSIFSAQRGRQLKGGKTMDKGHTLGERLGEDEKRKQHSEELVLGQT